MVIPLPSGQVGERDGNQGGSARAGHCTLGLAGEGHGGESQQEKSERGGKAAPARHQ